MTEDLSKGKKRGKKAPRERIHYHVMLGTPPAETGAHAAACGHVEALQQDRPDLDKTTGNPYPNSYAAERGARNSGRVAVNHPDLRQSNTDFSEAFSRLHTARGDRLDPPGADPMADGNMLGGFSHPGEVALRLFDAAGMAGSFRGMQDVNPDPLRPADHIARTSATADDGSHSCESQQQACSTPRQSMKASDRLRVMKETMRIIE